MTIKQLLRDLLTLDITSSDEYDDASKIQDVLRKKIDEWYSSVHYQNHLEEEQKLHEKKSKVRLTLLKRRYNQTKKWIKDHTIKEGSFIKVTGARDGEGIRQVVELADNERIICRKWSRVSKHHYMRSSAHELLREGYRQVEDMWVCPRAEMTTHYYNKVAKVFMTESD